MIYKKCVLPKGSTHFWYVDDCQEFGFNAC